jgi:hypothetical protein
MTATSAMTRFCGAKTRGGGECKRPAGWGTSHVGFGSCKLHAGSTPSGEAAGVNAEARAMAALTVAEEIEPGEALLWAVWLAMGQLKAANTALADIEDFDSARAKFWLERQEAAHDRVARFSESALRQGIAERRLRMIERSAEHLAAAFEDAIAVFTDASAEQRAQAVERFTGRLAVLGSGDDA